MGVPRTTIHPVSGAVKQVECGCSGTLYSACFQTPAALSPRCWPMCGECSWAFRLRATVLVGPGRDVETRWKAWMREPVVENKAETGIKHHHFLRALSLACNEANTRR